MLQSLYVFAIMASTKCVSKRITDNRGNSVNKEVIIRLKWNQAEYTGRLVSVDSYMNIQLSGAEEWMGGKNTGTLGQVLIRCVLSVFCKSGAQKAGRCMTTEVLTGVGVTTYYGSLRGIKIRQTATPRWRAEKRKGAIDRIR